MRTFLTILFIVSSVILSALILIQDGNKSGLGAIAGQTGDGYWNKIKGNREAGLFFKLTAALTALFFILALAINILN